MVESWQVGDVGGEVGGFGDAELLVEVEGLAELGSTTLLARVAPPPNITAAPNYDGSRPDPWPSGTSTFRANSEAP
jgi:hypothetical protein